MVGLAAVVDTRRPVAVSVAVAAIVLALTVVALSLWVCLRAYRRTEWRKESTWPLS